MGKKIVILNGSPRPKGNTVGLIEAFVKGAEQAGDIAGHPSLEKAYNLGKNIYKGGTHESIVD